MKDHEIEFGSDDITSGVTERLALDLTFDAVQSVDWPEFKWHGPTPGPALETLITLAYAKGVFASTEIERACRTNDSFRYCCAGDFPAANEIGAFRRAFKPWIEQSLKALCERLIPESHRAGSQAAERLLKAIRLDTAVFEV